MSSLKNIPKSMLAIEISKFGAPEVLKETTRKIPKIKANQLLIKTAAAGINRPDCLQRSGIYPPPKDASDLPGLEVSGEIVAIGDDIGGDNINKWQIGDNVTALTAGGGYAEFTVANAGHCLRWPKGFDAIMAASLPEVCFTVWSNIFIKGNLQAGETLLIHGGASGIGTMAIQMAKNFGATVIVTASSDKKCQFCVDLGADHAINYKSTAWQDEIMAITDGQGVDVILDMVAGRYIQHGINSLKRNGRYLLLAFLQGAKADINFTKILTNSLTISGSTLRRKPDIEKNIIAKSLNQFIWPLLDNNRITPIIDSVFPLSKAVDAHRLMETNNHIGKIILEI